MKLTFFCPYWGSEHIDFAVFCEKAKEEGYDGVEIGIPTDQKQKQYRIQAAEQFGLEIIGQHYETLEADFNKHQKLFRQYLENIADSPSVFINSQTGKDYYTINQNRKLIDLASMRYQSKEGVKKIVHETHRGKFSFAAHIAKQYLQLLPDLRITLDISHWCNVAESFLHDQQDAIDLAISRTDHIHSQGGISGRTTDT